MKQINIVATSVLRRKIVSPTYYWMIFAPLIVGFFLLFFNQYLTSSKETAPVIAVVGSKKITTQLKALPAKTYTLSNDTIVKKNITPSYLSEFKISGVLQVDDELKNIKYSYYSEYGGTAMPTELKQKLNYIRSLNNATKLGLTKEQWNKVLANAEITEKDLSSKRASDTQTAKSFSELLIICSFFILTSYVSIVGAEIGKEKGNHLLAGLLAAISAKRHFAGKMLGILYLILFQLVIYALLFILLKGRIDTKYLYSLNLIDLNSISTEYILFSVTLVVSSVILFILLTALLSATVSKNEDISQVTTGVSTLVLIPYMLSFIAQSAPNLGLLKILSVVPFFNQGILPIRIILNSTSIAVGWLVVGINIVSCIFLYRIAAKVYQRNAFNYDSKNIIQKIKMLFKQKGN